MTDLPDAPRGRLRDPDRIRDGVELADDITTPPETSPRRNNVDDPVVDHKAEDFAGRVVDHKAEDFVGRVVDHKAEDFAGDPIGDALAPLDDGDQFQALPELDASIDAASQLGIDDTEPDLGDGI